MDIIIQKFVENIKQFESESHNIFSKFENSPSRIMSLDSSRKKLSHLSINQTKLFEDSLKCAEYQINRAAIVMAWAGFIDYLEQRMSSDGMNKIKIIRPNWSKYNSIEEIRENGISEHELIRVAKDMKLITKGDMKRLHGELSKRNDCAHPSSYNPDLNEVLGYISGLINLIEDISKKTV